MTDPDLVNACREGRESAYQELFERYQARALRVAFALLGERAEAEDAAQEGFVQAFRSIGRLNPDSEFGPWLYRSVVWAARNRQRAGRRWRTALDRFLRDAPAVAPADDVDARHSVIHALRGLPPEQREVVVLRFFLDLPEAEVAAILGCRLGTVKSRAARALRRLAQSPELAWRAPKLEGSCNAG